MSSAPTDTCVVADTGPLLAIARLDGLGWPAELFRRVCVPQSVFTEAGRYPEREDFQRVSARLRSDARYVLVPDYLDQDVVGAELGRGETVALSIARRDEARVLIDDRDARVFARTLSLRVVGTLGVLVLAKQRGLIADLAPQIRRLRASGYFLRQLLVREVLKAVKERRCCPHSSPSR